jgi:hypothetical protein
MPGWCLTSDMTKDSLLSVNILANNGHVTYLAFANAFGAKMECARRPARVTFLVLTPLREGGLP